MFLNVPDHSLLVKGSLYILQGKCTIGNAIDHNLQYADGATLSFEGGSIDIAGSIVSKGKANRLNFGTADIRLNTLSPAYIDKSLLDIVAIESNIAETQFHFINPVSFKKRERSYCSG